LECGAAHLDPSAALGMTGMRRWRSCGLRLDVSTALRFAQHDERRGVGVGVIIRMCACGWILREPSRRARLRMTGDIWRGSG